MSGTITRSGDGLTASGPYQVRPRPTIRRHSPKLHSAPTQSKSNSSRRQNATVRCRSLKPKLALIRRSGPQPWNPGLRNFKRIARMKLWPLSTACSAIRHR